MGGPAYTVTAVSGSGLPVSLAAGAGSGSVCKVSGSSVSLIGAGTCTVEAEQPGNGDYERAPRAQQSFGVVAAPAAPTHQSIAFTTSAPALAIVGGPIYSVAATASSGLAVSFGASPSSAGICTVSGAVVAFVGEGTCIVLAHQLGDDLYLAAPTAHQSFLVDRAPQAVSFVSTPPASATAGTAAYTVAAAATSGLPVSIAVAQSSASVCAIAGGTVTALDAGTCTIEANQPGDVTFRAATQVQQSFNVGSPAPSLSAQTIDFTSTPPAAATIGGPAYAVAATASSGLPVGFSASAASAGVCSVSGTTVSLLGAGTCTILADQAGSGGYHAAPQAQQSFAIARASQAISFASMPPVPAGVGGPDYAISASASSGLPVAFAAAPASAGICTVSGSTVSPTGAGTCIVVATQGGNAVYDAADPVQQSFTVGPGAPTLSPQTISFTSTAPGAAVVGGPAYTVGAAASSGLAVVFTLASGSAGVCSLSGATVSLVGVGTCTINANQAGNTSYQPALQVQQSFTVVTPPPASQAISFTSSAPGAAVYGGPSYTVSATASSGLPVAFTAAPSSAGVCTVSGSTVTIVGERNLHRQRESGRQRHVSRRTPGAAVLQRRPHLPDDHDHVGNPRPGRQAQPAVHGHGHGDLRTPAHLHHRAVECGDLLDLGCLGQLHEARRLHRPREPGRQRQLSAGAPGAAGDHRHPACVTDESALSSPDRGRPAAPDRPMRGQAFPFDQFGGERI